MRNILSRAVISVAMLGVWAPLATAGIAYPSPPPDWPGSPGFTCQTWEFPTPSQPQPPDPGWINPFGVPDMRLKGNPQWLPVFPPPPNPGTKDGVWCLTNTTTGLPPDSLNFLIPNANRLEDQKEIIVFVKWFGAAAAGFHPGYQVLTPNQAAPINIPAATFTQPADPSTHPGWFIDTLLITLPKCPAFEEIKVGAFDVPQGVNLYIDYVSIYTRCIPTPGAISMLALAGLAAVRRRRH